MRRAIDVILLILDSKPNTCVALGQKIIPTNFACRDKRQTAELPRSGHLLCFRPGLEPATLAMRRTLWRKENFACVRIFYRGSRGKTKDLDVARIRSERTRN
jgi:hypothetical protein